VTEATAALRRTPLHASHLVLHARMVPYAGYEMPVQYTSIIEEHRAVRGAVGLERHLLDLATVVGRAFDVELAAFEHDVLFGRLEGMGGDLLGLVDDLLRGHLDRHPADGQRARPVGPVAEGGALAGVAVLDLDLVVGDAQGVGHDLAERGLVPLAVRVGAGPDRHRTGWIYAYLRRLHEPDPAGGGSGGGRRAEAGLSREWAGLRRRVRQVPNQSGQGHAR